MVFRFCQLHASQGPDELHHKVMEIYSNRECLIDKGKEGQEFASRNHDSVAIAKRVAKTYKSIIGEAK